LDNLCEGEACSVDEAGLSLLQTRVEKHNHQRSAPVHALNATLHAASRYLHGTLDKSTMHQLMKDTSDFPDNDETPLKFQQAHLRNKRQGVPGDWTLSTIVYNNLGNTGPDSGPEGIRYSNVATLNDRSVDLIVNAMGPYQKHAKSSNGLNGAVGKINLYHMRDCDFKFSFVDTANSQPVNMGAVSFSVFDLDEGPDGMAKESITMGGFTNDYMMDFTSIRTQDLPDGRRQYSSTAHGRGSNNPSDPFTLTEVQAAHSVTFDLPAGTSDFTVNYAVTEAPTKERMPDFFGRNFLFAGASSLYYCKTEPVEIHYDMARVVYSNLGNMGPDNGSPEGIRYHNIATVRGRPLDLMIHALGDYVPFKNIRNGLKGHYGLINMRKGDMQRFKFQFVDPANDAPFTLDQVYLSVLDLDEGKRGKLRESVVMETPYATAFTTEDTEIVINTLGDGSVRYDSSTPGTGKDNPKDPMLLNERQKNRAVTFLFDSLSEWTVSLGTGEGPPSGRNFMFSGKSSVVFC